jgi:hypothetical protein
MLSEQKTPILSMMPGKPTEGRSEQNRWAEAR